MGHGLSSCNNFLAAGLAISHFVIAPIQIDERLRVSPLHPSNDFAGQYKDRQHRKPFFPRKK
jgi:hypothetical protein